MADISAHAGTKRPYSSSLSEPAPHKKRRVQHRLHHVQRIPLHIEPAPQDAEFVGAQLLRSITAAVKVAGFEGVRPTALEMFRSHTEEYMLRFATLVRTVMQGQRRTKPTAQDFAMALAQMEVNGEKVTHTASDLKPQLNWIVPERISYPSIPDPPPAEAPAPDFSGLLGARLQTPRLSYIPKHFPPLPSTHTWKDTTEKPKREHSPRKMREIATQEGLQAEQALRKLATAAKAGAMKAEKKRSAVLGGPGKVRQGSKKMLQDEYDSFADAMREIGGADADGNVGMGMDGANDAEDGIDVGMPEGVVVNYDMGHWRHGGHRKSLRL